MSRPKGSKNKTKGKRITPTISLETVGALKDLSAIGMSYGAAINLAVPLLKKKYKKAGIDENNEKAKSWTNALQLEHRQCCKKL